MKKISTKLGKILFTSLRILFEEQKISWRTYKTGKSTKKSQYITNGALKKAQLHKNWNQEWVWLGQNQDLVNQDLFFDSTQQFTSTSPVSSFAETLFLTQCELIFPIFKMFFQSLTGVKKSVLKGWLLKAILWNNLISSDCSAELNTSLSPNLIPLVRSEVAILSKALTIWEETNPD